MNKFIGLLLLSIIFVQCGQDKDTMILKNQLGKITKSTSLEELDKIFKNDSIEKFPKDTDLIREYRVYGQDGKTSLVFLTHFENDSIKGLELVKIYSDLYVTEKGVSTKSTYKDVADNYSIEKIETSFSAAILFVDELNATVLLNKSDLNLDEFDMRAIRADQIPDEANINYISLWFE
ncbi:hypothetical protein QWY87_17750 [Lutimonas halocynthiae]|uniref:hypothetical protein n=1 Tax=Lutimonas halocynthiae TaxID=1446477 RepID=UPI0025B3489C|nr:hypothetical protein [Lutimonas halocynthiae]MDN3644564.1 hypothetical protein [Lutimonas halocynthiae]